MTRIESRLPPGGGSADPNPTTLSLPTNAMILQLHSPITIGGRNFPFGNYIVDRGQFDLLQDNLRRIAAETKARKVVVRSLNRLLRALADRIGTAGAAITVDAPSPMPTANGAAAPYRPAHTKSQRERVDVETLKRSVDLIALIGRVVKLRQDGHEFAGLCPFHKESTPSFRVAPSKGVYYCFGCGERGDAISFVEKIDGVGFEEACRRLGAGHLLPWRAREAGPAPVPVDIYDAYKPVDPPANALDLFRVGVKTPPILNIKRSFDGTPVFGSFKPSLVHIYRDDAGKLLGLVLRRDFQMDGKAEKECPTIRYVETPSGEQHWARMVFDQPRPLYGLDRIAANPDCQVLVHEGEKSADHGENIFRDSPLVNIAWPGGANNHDKVDWSPMAGRRVVLWPDCDFPGYRAMLGYDRNGVWTKGVAELALEAGAKRVVFLNVIAPDEDGFVPAKKGWDCADAAEAGWDAEQITRWAGGRRLTFENVDEVRDAAQRLASLFAAAGEHAAAGEEAQSGKLGRPAAADAFHEEPVTEADREILLDPRNPRPSAREFLRIRYMHADGRTLHLQAGLFYAWNGRCYPEADAAVLESEVWEFLERAVCLEGKDLRKPFKPNRTKVGEVMSALRSETVIHRDTKAPTWLGDATDLPPAGEVMACANGILHLYSRLLYPATPALYCHNAVEFNYADGASEPTEWLRFLAGVWPDDQETIDTLQEIFGYLLTPDTSLQKMFMIVGPKRSGKGTIGRILTQLLGKSNISSPTLASLASQFGLQPLIGKSLAVIGDARIGQRHDQAQIAERLLSISGEDSIDVDRKHLSAWTGKLNVRFLLLTNELPRLSDASGALASRFVVLRMTQSFYGKEDPGLIDRLTPELAGILNWSIDGWQRLQARGRFVVPSSSQEALEELEALGSPVTAFVRDCCSVGPGYRIAATELFQAWRRWCDAQGKREPGTAQTFGRDIQSAVAGLRSTRPRAKGAGPESRTLVYEGIKLGARDAPGRDEYICGSDSGIPF